MQKELVSVLRNTGHGFRLICTSNEDLEKLTDEGHFNDDSSIASPRCRSGCHPCAERIEDLPVLVK